MATQEIIVFSFDDGAAWIAVQYDDSDYTITGIHVVNTTPYPIHVEIEKPGRNISGDIPGNTDRVITVLRNFKLLIGIDPDPEFGGPSLNFGNCRAIANMVTRMR